MFRVSVFAIADNLGPNREAHNERVKFIAVILNAVGLGVLAAGVVGSVFDPARGLSFVALPAVAIWLAATLGAYHVLGYMRAKE
jgi:hypothetical protein